MSLRKSLELNSQMAVKSFAPSFVDKPWGSEDIWAHTSDYVAKIITINPQQSLSRQYHNEKHETIRVLSGVLRLETGCYEEDDLKIEHLVPGQTFQIPPLLIHRFCADADTVVLAEVSTNHLKDVVRLEDNYGRAAK